jgi:hypothetical protein
MRGEIATICQAIAEIERREGESHRKMENVRRTEDKALALFPDEIWEAANEIKLEYIQLLPGAEHVKVAKSRFPVNKSQEFDFLKEIKSAIILQERGSSVYLIPKMRSPDGNGEIPGPDAIVNGSLFEFKTVTGGLKKVEERFRESRVQGENVFCV